VARAAFSPMFSAEIEENRCQQAAVTRKFFVDL
jgi:hypothetical protein